MVRVGSSLGLMPVAWLCCFGCPVLCVSPVKGICEERKIDGLNPKCKNVAARWAGPGQAAGSCCSGSFPAVFYWGWRDWKRQLNAEPVFLDDKLHCFWSALSRKLTHFFDANSFVMEKFHELSMTRPDSIG